MPAIKPTQTVDGQALRHLRRDRKITLRALADRAGYSFGYVAKVERGVRIASDDTIAAIAGALQCSPAEFATTR